MSEERIVLKEVPSGKIELVFNGVFSVLQFNANCLDVLDVCKAMCCRLRSGYSVILQDEEKDKFLGRPHPHGRGLTILQDKPEDGSCVYLAADSRCSIHETGKPWACSNWHCSPGGVGDGVTHRDGGWFISPNKSEYLIDDVHTCVKTSEVIGRTL